MNVDKFFYLLLFIYLLFFDLARLLLTVSMKCSLAKLAPWRKGPYIWSKGKIQGSRRAEPQNVFCLGFYGNYV